MIRPIRQTRVITDEAGTPQSSASVAGSRPPISDNWSLGDSESPFRRSLAHAQRVYSPATTRAAKFKGHSTPVRAVGHQRGRSNANAPGVACRSTSQADAPSSYHSAPSGAAAVPTAMDGAKALKPIVSFRDPMEEMVRRTESAMAFLASVTCAPAVTVFTRADTRIAASAPETAPTAPAFSAWNREAASLNCGPVVRPAVRAAPAARPLQTGPPTRATAKQPARTPSRAWQVQPGTRQEAQSAGQASRPVVKSVRGKRPAAAPLAPLSGSVAGPVWALSPARIPQHAPAPARAPVSSAPAFRVHRAPSPRPPPQRAPAGPQLHAMNPAGVAAHTRMATDASLFLLSPDGDGTGVPSGFAFGSGVGHGEGEGARARLSLHAIAELPEDAEALVEACEYLLPDNPAAVGEAYGLREGSPSSPLELPPERSPRATSPPQSIPAVPLSMPPILPPIRCKNLHAFEDERCDLPLRFSQSYACSASAATEQQKASVVAASSLLRGLPFPALSVYVRDIGAEIVDGFDLWTVGGRADACTPPLSAVLCTRSNKSDVRGIVTDPAATPSTAGQTLKAKAPTPLADYRRQSTCGIAPEAVEDDDDDDAAEPIDYNFSTPPSSSGRLPLRPCACQCGLSFHTFYDLGVQLENPYVRRDFVSHCSATFSEQNN
jgi:hypothetical protein